MGFYIYNLGVPLFFACISKVITPKLRPIWFCLSVSYFAILLASRSFGNDTESYVSIFEDINSASDFAQLFSINVDVGFSFLVKLLTYISDDRIFLFSSISIISITALSFSYPSFVKNKPLATFLIMMLFSAGFYSEAIRAGIAMSIVMIYFRASSAFLKIISFIVAASLHASSILVLTGSLFKLDKFPLSSTCFIALIFYIAIPNIYHINYKIYWYITEGFGDLSIVAFTYALIFIIYIRVSACFFNYANRSRICSSALFAFSASIGFSIYSEIISSRIYEMGCFLFLLIIIFDIIHFENVSLSTARKLFLSGLVILFLVLYFRVYFIRFNYY